MGYSRRYLAVIIAVLLVAATAHAQQGNPVYVIDTLPQGTCVGSRVWVTNANPAVFWCCIGGTWEYCGSSSQGETGPEGPVGPEGPIGPAGADGAKGDTGARGFAGAQGLTGVAGPAGPQGAPGTNGVDGVDGVDGAQGDVGPEGPQGPQGIGAYNGLTCNAGYYINGFDTQGNLQCSEDQSGGSGYSLPALQANTLGGVKGTGSALACSAGSWSTGFNSSGALQCAAVPMPANCGSGYVETGNGTAHSCTNTIAIAGYASESEGAARLINDGANCAEGQAALGVDVEGAAQGCWTPQAQITWPTCGTDTFLKSSGAVPTCVAQSKIATDLQCATSPCVSDAEIATVSISKIATWPSCTSNTFLKSVAGAPPTCVGQSQIATDVQCASTCVADTEISAVGLAKVSGWPTCGSNTFLKSSGTTPTCVSGPSLPANCGTGYAETGNGVTHSCTQVATPADIWAVDVRGQQCPSGFMNAIDSVGQIGCASEADPKVGTIATSGNNWCRGASGTPNQVVCNNAAPSGTLIPRTCSAGYYVSGIDSGGNIACTALPARSWGCASSTGAIRSISGTTTTCIDVTTGGSSY